MRKAEKIGIWLAAISLAVTSAIALGAWLLPRAPAAKDAAHTVSAPRPSNASDSASPASISAAPTVGTPAATYLTALTPQSGGANLAALPRALAGKAGYDHPIVVRCPTNQSDDKVRSVTYPLRGRYLDFTATVRPHYPAERDARTYVTAIAGMRERDGTLTQQIEGTQFAATTTSPASLTAAVDGAETLTLDVQCESPQGVVVLVDARVTAAP